MKVGHAKFLFLFFGICSLFHLFLFLFKIVYSLIGSAFFQTKKKSCNNKNNKYIIFSPLPEHRKRRWKKKKKHFSYAFVRNFLVLIIFLWFSLAFSASEHYCEAVFAVSFQIHMVDSVSHTQLIKLVRLPFLLPIFLAFSTILSFHLQSSILFLFPSL